MKTKTASAAITEDSATASAQASAQARPADDDLRIMVDLQAGSPFAPAALEARAAVSTDHWGAFSVEKFAAASDLYDTHEDAEGWLNYLRQFQAENFWYKDAGVAPWAYYEQYDNWQDTYGMDAVLAAYHSGHGNMDGNGTFYAAMGKDWGGLGTNAVSSNMALGNEQVRYIFWSTCLSLRVLNGHNPIRTWNKANLGFRMLFGYETTSVDAPNYGRDFWKQWNGGKKSLSQAHLDMSWYDVSTHQAPSVVAVGASAAEAQDRLFNEKFLDWNAVSRNYWHWRWYYAARSALGARGLNQKLPRRIATAQLALEPASGNRIRGILDRIPVGVAMPSETSANPAGNIVISDGDRYVAVARNNGTYEAQLGAPNLESTNELGLSATIRKAQDVVHQFGLDRNDIAFDRVLYKCDCAGTAKGGGQIGTPRVSETVVQFTQMIDGVPVIGPGEGKVSVTLDNDENVTAVLDRTRTVAKLMEGFSAPSTFETSRDGASPPAPAPSNETDPEALLSAAWQDRLKTWVLRGRLPERYAVVPGSFEVGYVIRGNSAVLVAREEVEADCGGGFLKRFVVERPIQD
ncbi:DUF6345 domain-containing protein [Rhodococcus koreensis]